MRQFYKNVLLTIAIFSVVLLSHSLRSGGLFMTETLTLGFWFAIGLTGALLVGRWMPVHTR